MATNRAARNDPSGPALHAALADRTRENYDDEWDSVLARFAKAQEGQ